MICCKIIADYDNPDGSFSKLCDCLSQKGDLLWVSSANVMFFADVSGDTDEKKVIRYVKKAGYSKVFVDVYDKKHEPHENEEVNSWIAGKVAHLIAVEFYRNNAQLIKQTKDSLLEFDNELRKFVDEACEKQKQSDKTEDSN